MKNPFKKKNLPNPQAPRSLEEINKEYRELLVQVAQAQYLAYVKNMEVENLNKRILEVNQEAAQRQDLDKSVADAVKKEESNEKP